MNDLLQHIADGKGHTKCMLLSYLFISVLCLYTSNLYAQVNRHPQLAEYKSEKLFLFDANDSVQVEIELLKNDQNQPQLYRAYLSTGVCSDGLCKPVNIQIYWDLLGDFYEYETAKDAGLTKFDHMPFTADDHRRLHTILADTSSLLRDYYVEDLIDPQVKLRSKTIDGVTGATNTTFQATTVPGALYTVYTLWHFVNGTIRHRLFNNTVAMLSDSLIKQLLGSENGKYQRFMIAHLNEAQAEKFQQALMELVEYSKDDYVPHFALDKLPEATWQDATQYNQVLAFLPKMPFPVQTAILNKLTNTKMDAKGRSLLENHLVHTNSDVQRKLIKAILTK